MTINGANLVLTNTEKRVMMQADFFTKGVSMKKANMIGLLLLVLGLTLQLLAGIGVDLVATYTTSVSLFVDEHIVLGELSPYVALACLCIASLMHVIRIIVLKLLYQTDYHSLDRVFDHHDAGVKELSVAGAILITFALGITTILGVLIYSVILVLFSAYKGKVWAEEYKNLMEVRESEIPA